MYIPSFKGFSSILLFLCFASAGGAQQLKLYPSAAGANVQRPGTTDLFANPWSGGMLNPMFSNIDLDGDSLKDLFVFEPYDNKVLTFRNLGNSAFRYEPEYEAFFPKDLKHFALLVDYNLDGKEDIFTYSTLGGGMDVYLNVSDTSGLKFRKVVELLYYQDIDFDLNLYTGPVDLPAISDVDGDGDIDVISLDVFQSNFQYYRNMSMEKYGNADSLEFRIADRCWGKMQTTMEDTVRMGFYCGQVGKIAYPEGGKIGLGHSQLKKHGSMAATVLDVDGDGDADMLLGNLFYPNILHIENGRIRQGKPDLVRDSAVSQDNTWPAGTQNASVTVYPAAFIVDVDGDGVKDMVLSPQAQEESATSHQVLYYKNEGTNSKVSFNYKKDDLLLDGMLSGGYYAAPAYWDFNGDGLKDMVLATKGNPELGYDYDKLVLYKNIGNADSALYQEADTSWASHKTQKVAYSYLTFADLDGDGVEDMLAGGDNGKLLYYRNKGLSAGVPQMNLVTNAYQSIDVGAFSAPELADLDKDGLPDLVIGRQDGRFSYYKNTGTASAPVFSWVTDSFGHARTNNYYYSYTYDDRGKIKDSTLEMVPNGHSAPRIADIDGNGVLDMVSGATSGRLFFYFDMQDSVSGKFTARHDVLYNTRLKGFEDKSFGILSRPALGDLNADTIPELLVGNYRGGMQFYSSKEFKLSNIFYPHITELGLKVYPNPSSAELFIELSEANTNGKYTFSLYNVNGQMQANGMLGNIAQRQKVDVSGLAPGLYLLRISDATGSAATARFVKR